MTKPLTSAETKEMEAFLNSELTNQGQHGLLAEAPSSSPAREFGIQTSQSLQTANNINEAEVAEIVVEVSNNNDDDDNYNNGDNNDSNIKQ